MKKIFLLLLLLPVIVFSQTKNTEPEKGFVISGNVTGYADGTSVSFVNNQTGSLEKQTTIEKNKFTIKGEMPEPGIMVLVFGEQPPGIPLFLDNSHVKISGSKDSLDKLVITGSSSHNDFTEFSKELKPYENLFAEGAVPDKASMEAVEKICDAFVEKHPASFVSPVAIIRLLQVSANSAEVEKLYAMMPAKVQGSSLGQYVNQQIQESKINPIGSVIKDFSQTDTAGKPISIASLRGKYVLVDFWASWCRPCRMENPNVVAAYNKYHDKNFTILSVSLDQAKPAWMDAIKMDGLIWNHVSDLQGWNNAVATLFQIRQIPQNILIDPAGKIIAKNLRGPMLDSELSQVLQ